MSGDDASKVPSDKVRKISGYGRGHSYPGLLIVFEGPDGGGKSTQHQRFIKKMGSLEYEVLEVREPGATTIGERVRDILLDPSHAEMSLETELLLYNASRAQMVRQLIIPALEEGKIIVADRLYHSTLAYQGTAGGLPPEVVLPVISIAMRGIKPDVCYIYDVDPDVAAKRLNPLLDRMEQKGKEFHQKVRDGYLGLASLERATTKLIDTSELEPDKVTDITWKDFSERFLANPDLVSKLKRKA